MRPQRWRAASTIAASVCSLVDVGLERDAVAARLPTICDRFLGRGEIVVDGEHLGAFLREAQHGGAAIAHALAGRLAGADDDGDLVLETHAASAKGSGSRDVSKSSVDPPAPPPSVMSPGLCQRSSADGLPEWKL